MFDKDDINKLFISEGKDGTYTGKEPITQHIHWLLSRMRNEIDRMYTICYLVSIRDGIKFLHDDRSLSFTLVDAYSNGKNIDVHISSEDVVIYPVPRTYPDWRMLDVVAPSALGLDTGEHGTPTIAYETYKRLRECLRHAGFTIRKEACKNLKNHRKSVAVWEKVSSGVRTTVAMPLN